MHPHSWVQVKIMARRKRSFLSSHLCFTHLFLTLILSLSRTHTCHICLFTGNILLPTCYICGTCHIHGQCTINMMHCQNFESCRRVFSVSWKSQTTWPTTMLDSVSLPCVLEQCFSSLNITGGLGEKQTTRLHPLRFWFSGSDTGHKDFHFSQAPSCCHGCFPRISFQVTLF